MEGKGGDDKVRAKKEESYVKIIIFFLGLMIGTIYANFLLVGQTVLLPYEWDFLGQMSQFSKHEIAAYIILKRIKQCVGCAFLGVFIRPKIVLMGVSSLFGAFLGCFLSLGTMDKGFLGMIQCLFFLMPHYICYLLAFFCLNYLTTKKGKEEGNGKKWSRLILSAIFIFSGIMLEGYVNLDLVGLFCK